MFTISSQSLLLGGFIGYFVGSIPFAYLITKWRTGKDLRREGSGNIGARNAFEVTQDKQTGIFVLIADLLKGLLPVLAFEMAGQNEALLVLVPALILGHCYPIWLRFHGGRGLATIGGAIMLINPAMAVLWSILYFIARRLKDHVHFGAIGATGGTMAVVLLAPLPLLDHTTLAISGLTASDMHELTLSVALALLIILSRHVGPFVALMRSEDV